MSEHAPYRIEVVQEGPLRSMRIFHVREGRPYARPIYCLRAGDVAATYEANPVMAEYASLNLHARTNVTGVMTTAPEHTCEFLDHECPCWFDGTSLMPAQANDEDIWKLLAAWLPSSEGAP